MRLAFPIAAVTRPLLLCPHVLKTQKIKYLVFDVHGGKRPVKEPTIYARGSGLHVVGTFLGTFK